MMNVYSSYGDVLTDHRTNHAALWVVNSRSALSYLLMGRQLSIHIPRAEARQLTE